MKIINRKANFNFQIFDKFEAGVVLTGPEVKSVYLGQATLDEAYVKDIDGELFLVNAHIHPYQYAQIDKIDPKRSRKLLMHKRELLELQGKIKQKNLIIVPLSWYNKGRQIKLEIGLAKGKKIWEKRETIKKHDLDRDAQTELAKPS